MKKTISFIIAASFILSLSANARLAQVKLITLSDDSIISSQDISAIHLAPDKSSIDFIELNEGAKIESSEIKNVYFQNSSIPKVKDNNAYENFNNTLFAKGGGDGSGG
jgi:hypothetical protein